MKKLLKQIISFLRNVYYSLFNPVTEKIKQLKPKQLYL